MQHCAELLGRVRRCSPDTMILNFRFASWWPGVSFTICSTRSMMRPLRLFLVHDLLKPLCTRGRLP